MNVVSHLVAIYKTIILVPHHPRHVIAIQLYMGYHCTRFLSDMLPIWSSKQWPPQRQNGVSDNSCFMANFTLAMRANVISCTRSRLDLIYLILSYIKVMACFHAYTENKFVDLDELDERGIIRSVVSATGLKDSIRIYTNSFTTSKHVCKITKLLPFFFISYMYRILHFYFQHVSRMAGWVSYWCLMMLHAQAIV